jgi:hypothetical protein
MVFPQIRRDRSKLIVAAQVALLEDEHYTLEPPPIDQLQE